MKWVLDLLGRFAPLRHVVDYRLVEKESVHQCPACKADVHESSIPFARLDRYGFPVTTSWCQRCDLLYVSPRPTPTAYKAFYDSGDYRRLIAAFSGREDDHRLPQSRVQQLASFLAAHVPNRPLSVLNIGGTRADYEVLAGHIAMGRYVCLNPGENEAGPVSYTHLSRHHDAACMDDQPRLLCLSGRFVSRGRWLPHPR